MAALGSLLYGSADFCGGIAARRGGAVVVTFFSGIAGLLVVLAPAPFVPGLTRPTDLAYGLAGGAFGAVGAMLAYRALAIGPVTVASPIFSVTGLCLPVMVGVILGERPSAPAIAGLALTPASIVLLSQGGGIHPEHPTHPRRVILPALVAGAVLGFFLVFLGRIERGANLWPLVVARVAGLACLMSWLVIRRASLVPAPPARGIALLTGALDSLANLAYVLAAQRGSLSLVAALVSLGPATTVLLARGILGERWSPMQRAGLACALLAGVLISVG